MKKILYLIILLAISTTGYAQTPFKVTGRVEAEGAKLPGASIKVKGASNFSIADANGRFSIMAAIADSLIISYLGYQSQTVQASASELYISLIPVSRNLHEVTVSTGYQQLNKERATGSFVQVDNELLERSVSTDILSRLNNVVPGLTTPDIGGTIRIRGQSTIFGKADPLIVIDNFPYDGSMDNINPNDVESITVLKDAAAASIWGARAGNGVIVITTKKGGYNKKHKVSFNSVLSTAEKPDLYHVPRMSVSDVIDLEKRLFNEGFYQSTETSADKTVLTPVIELLIAKRDHKIDPIEADAQIEALKLHDLRDDLNKYLYRHGLKQQYSAQLSGGSNAQKYFVSAGYDKNLDPAIGNAFNRVTLNATNTYAMLKNKLELTTGIYFTESRADNNAPGAPSMSSTSSGIYPYARLADEDGNARAVPRDYRADFAAGAESKGLLNWLYKPLDEIKASNDTRKIVDYRVNANLKYQFIPDLNLELLYQYNRGNSENRNLQGVDSYFTRNMINRFTKINTDGSLSRPVPLGGILDQYDYAYTSNNLRAQLNFNKEWSDHSINAIAGAEGKDLSTSGNTFRQYGYDEEHATSSIANYFEEYPLYHNPSRTDRILNSQSISDLSDRFLSYFMNAAYSYKLRYTLSLSGRKDMSNLFGVKTNQKGVPLYSAGLSWNIDREDFYKLNWLPYLKLRATYGYNGNVDKSLSAYTTASYNNGINTTTKFPYADIKNPPNPQLRWERIRIVNFGVDFESKSGIIGGSIEYYTKKGIDLIGSASFPPSTGITSFRGNTANTSGKGFDLALNTRNLNGAFKWNSNFIFSYVTDKVTNYLLSGGSAISLITSGSQNFPQEGKPLYGIYSYGWAGLDPLTGDPQGYVEGEISKDYLKINESATPENIVYNGTSRAPVFGALRNTFTYKGFSASCNISYRFGYYFRRNSITYGNSYGSGGHGDYYLRWQQPGDELHTQVPSIPVIANDRRDQFYTYSAALVSKGDHIRLQDIRLAYSLDKATFAKLPFSRINIFLYAANLGLLWKANNEGLDPNFLNSAPIKSLSAGLKLDF